MVRAGGGECFKPELGDGGEEDSFSGNRVGEDDVVGGDAVGRDKPDFVLPAIDISNFPRSEKKRGSSHTQ